MGTPASWEDLLRSPVRRDHLAQLYTQEPFLARTVAHFLASGLAAGDGAIVFATPGHADMFAERLGAAGVDVASAARRDQLIIFDAARSLAELSTGGAPDQAALSTFLKRALSRARAAGFSNVRLFAEMVDLLWNAADLDGAMQLEAIWNAALAEEGVVLLCAYRIDNFDRRAQQGVVPRIAQSHSHLIPVEDYARLDRAVDDAYRDVFGELGNGEALRAILESRSSLAPQMPPGQRALVGLRELSPTLADAVLERAGRHYRAHGRHGAGSPADLA